jgi:hypothetical protein
LLLNTGDNFLSTTIKFPDLDLQIEQISVFHFFIELLTLPSFFVPNGQQLAALGLDHVRLEA